MSLFGKVGKESKLNLLKHANIVADGLFNNDIFELSSNKNRDNCLYPYWLLKQKFLEKGIALNTADINAGDKKIDFCIHLNAQTTDASQLNYLMRWETSQLLPTNGDKKILDAYQIVFTWDDGLVDGLKYHKLNFPNQKLDNAYQKWGEKQAFCCMIAGNKSLLIHDKRELYSHRISAIRWFERNAPSDFGLYGIGWNTPAAKSGYIGKIFTKIYAYLYPLFNIRPFPSYQGTVVSKNEVLSKYKFFICYENVADLPGYITEKIFDCFFAGFFPVYWGASNIEKYIPETCFIDRRKFDSHEDLYAFLKTIDESTYADYQSAIASFINSDAAKPFYAEHFAETVVNTIIADLEKQ